MPILQWMIFLFSSLALTGCFNDSLDELSSHQIIAAPKNRWVHWGQENPVDVSNEEDSSHKACQRKRVN